MKKTLLIITMLFYAVCLNAQNGNTLNNAIEVNGTEISLNLLDFSSATASGLTPSCGNGEDVFYKHTTATGHNKMTIGMASVGLTLLTSIDYQIFVAPNGDTGQLQELDCDSYSVVVLVGGSFQFVIEDVEEANTYYLRVYRPTGTIGFLTNLLNGTTVTMTSSFDSTLSINEVEKQDLKYFIKDDLIKFQDNTSFNQFRIYGLDGKQILKNQTNDIINSINISQLKKGIYIMNLSNNNSSKVFKIAIH